MRIREFIRDQFKRRLDAAGCLVVYDGERRYRECLLALAGETCSVIDVGESIITAREQALNEWLKLARPGKAAKQQRQLVVYVPAPKPETDEDRCRDPFQIFALGFGLFPESDGDSYQALCRRAKPDFAVQIETLFQAGVPGFDTVDNVGAGKGWPQLRTLLGVSIKLGDLLPDDGSVAGFDNVSEGLDVSSAHLLRYQEAADRALNAAIVFHSPGTLAYRLTGKETAEKNSGDGGFRDLLGKAMRLDGERLHVYIHLNNHISIQSPDVPTTGRYRLRLVAQALNTDGRPLPLEVSVARDNEKRTLATFDVPPDRPGVFELETLLQEQTRIRINGWQLPGENEMRDRLKGQPLETYTGPSFAFELMELEGPLDDHAIASRLSCFLWSALPDGDLIALAARGELRKPAVLQAQVERMLSDKRSQRFIEDFTGQWLELRKINATSPDPSLYREFDAFLLWSMPLETQMYFGDMLRHDRSVAEFVHSDWTMLNSRLAKHYGIDGVHGGELRRVALRPESHRGGVLTHASILKLTANGTTTSPILRGKWVLEKERS